MTHDDYSLRITMEGDGVDLPSQTPPWSIASRVRELGGQIQAGDGTQAGSHMPILLPRPEGIPGRSE